MKSSDYHDYVFKDGKFVGDFEGMYQNSSEIPWHMDKGVEKIFSRVSLTILKKFHEEHHFKTVCDLGCGLGYMTEKIKAELAISRITGMDVSFTAIEKAQKLFPDIAFKQYNILNKNNVHEEKYNLVIAKNILWYVLEDVNLVFSNINALTDKFFFMTQSFPSSETFVGQDLFPDAMALADFISKKFNVLYRCVENNDVGEQCLHIFATKAG